MSTLGERLRNIHTKQDLPAIYEFVRDEMEDIEAITTDAARENRQRARYNVDSVRVDFFEALIERIKAEGLDVVSIVENCADTKDEDGFVIVSRRLILTWPTTDKKVEKDRERDRTPPRRV